MVNLIDTIELDKGELNVKIDDLELGVYRVIGYGKDEIFEVIESNIDTKTLIIRYRHHIYELSFKNELDQVLDKMGIKRSFDALSTDIKAPMPGKVIDVIVKEGDSVKKGDAILILEAMKMENVLKSDADCTIKKVHVKSAESVEKNQVLVELD